MLKLKLQYFSHLIWRVNSLEKTLMLGKVEGEREREWQGMRWLENINSMDMSLSKLQETVQDRWPCHAIVHGAAKSQNNLATEEQQIKLKNNNIIHCTLQIDYYWNSIVKKKKLKVRICFKSVLIMYQEYSFI